MIDVDQPDDALRSYVQDYGPMPLWVPLAIFLSIASAGCVAAIVIIAIWLL